MNKNLVIFCDGTWNSPNTEEFGAVAHTNVYRLYRICKDAAETNEQLLWYQSGVGAYGGSLKRAFEGATGTGVGANIRRGYMAIAKNYNPGDRIFLFGFSRGAFTARSIAGMIEKVGLLTSDQANEKSVSRAYNLYRRIPKQQSELILKSKNEVIGNEHFHENVKIHCIGIWDTVAALGFSFWGVSFNFRLFKNDFHELSPNKVTLNVFHALAMDEMRTTYIPTLWDLNGTTTDKPHVEQAWFRGVHSDVGGGYADHELADISLLWMKKKCEGLGLLIREGAFSDIKRNYNGRIHTSYKGLLWTHLADWPRWYPTVWKTNASAKTGYLHSSVRKREDYAQKFGWNEPRIQFPTPEGVSVIVKANLPWNNTGLILEAGCHYEITAKGWWQDSDESPVQSDGQPANEESLVKKIWRPYRRASRERWMRLIGVINYPRDWHWSERSPWEALYYLLVKDPDKVTKDFISIDGKSKDNVIPNETGILWVFANDWWKTYENNSGSLVLHVKKSKLTSRTIP